MNQGFINFLIGKAAYDILAPPGNQWLKTNNIERVNWNRLFYDDQSNLFVLTSIHESDPFKYPDKIVTFYKMKEKKWIAKIKGILKQFESQNINVSDPTSFNV